MGTAFSASLLGLAGSLVLGFLELQASQAQNRFYNELEEWLSGITELTPAGERQQRPDQPAALCRPVRDAARARRDRRPHASRRHRRGAAAAPAAGTDEAVKELARGVDQLVTQMRAEQKVVREWVDEQAAQQSEVAAAAARISPPTSGREGLSHGTRTRRAGAGDYGEFWPGYVDVLSTLLLVVTFLLSIFMLAQFFVSQEASGKDTALRRLTRQIAELTSLLSLEKGKSQVRRGRAGRAAGVAGVAARRERAAVRPGAGSATRRLKSAAGAHRRV